jgi:hypothetical protein
VCAWHGVGEGVHDRIWCVTCGTAVPVGLCVGGRRARGRARGTAHAARSKTSGHNADNARERCSKQPGNKITAQKRPRAVPLNSELSRRLKTAPVPTTTVYRVPYTYSVLRFTRGTAFFIMPLLAYYNVYSRKPIPQPTKPRERMACLVSRVSCDVRETCPPARFNQYSRDWHDTLDSTVGTQGRGSRPRPTVSLIT